MARDRGLEELLRSDLDGVFGLAEQPMFGGLAWLLDGRLLCAARHDGLLVRLGEGNVGWALALDDTQPMMSGSRLMRGWVRAGPSAFGDDDQRSKLLNAALTFVSALPVKAPRD